VSFRFLDLPASTMEQRSNWQLDNTLIYYLELRNHIYEYAAVGDGEPVRLLNVSKRQASTPSDNDAKPTTYRMRLAQKSKQIHGEYLPIHVRKLESWFTAKRLPNSRTRSTQATHIPTAAQGPYRLCVQPP
jgi:hypothetical protein